MELIVLRDDQEIAVSVGRVGDEYVVDFGGQQYRVERAEAGRVRTLLVQGRQYEVAVDPLGAGRYRVASALGTETVEVLDPLAHLAEQTKAGVGGRGRQRVTAYMPGRVVQLMVAVGDAVDPGQGLVVLEAMKMENEIQAERAGVVQEILVEEGQAVEGGDPLFEIE